MATSPLTGRDAAEAIGLCAQLGDSGARFDARRLGGALRTAAGRGRIRAGLTLAILVPRSLKSRARGTRRSPLRRVLRAAHGSGPPGRLDPSEPREATGDGR